MDSAAHVLGHAHQLYARVGGGAAPSAERPPLFKFIGIGLAVGSGVFIGTSFVLKKVGLLKANEKYNEVAGEGYGYLKNFYWWVGMTLMIIGEGLNFAAYAFTDAILVTPLGALSVVITTILSAIFLKERLSMIGKIACFLCIVGSVVIVMNAPETSSVSTIQEMQGFVIHPAFLSYTGVVIVGSIVAALWLGPKYGSKNMLVYISICSWIGGLSVVATQGLGAAIIAQAGGTPQFNQWFLYVLLAFVIGTLLTEIVYLNKALNLFNAALVTPTYYVYFTSTTIISSAILFRGFKGTPTSIITLVNGFLTICSGVVLLQLSKSAKDVPDTAVFAGDLDQIQTIAEQPQPETEPKADAIRGTAAIVRRLSSARQKMELDELKRLHEEKQQEALEAAHEHGVPQYEWDGIRRRRTGTYSTHEARSMTSPTPTHLAPPIPHPPLGWSHFPTEEELAEANRPLSPALSNFMGTIRSRARSVLLPGHPDFRGGDPHQTTAKPQSPMHPVQLTSIVVPGSKPPDIQVYEPDDPYSPPGSGSLSNPKRRVHPDGQAGRNFSGRSSGTAGSPPPTPPAHSAARRQFSFQNMFKRHHQHHHDGGGYDGSADSSGPRRFRLSSRGYSSPQVFIRDATEEETLGLVKRVVAPEKKRKKEKRDARSGGNHYRDSSTSTSDDYYYHDDEDEEEEEEGRVVGGYVDVDVEEKQSRYGHSITRGYHGPNRGGSPPARQGPGQEQGRGGHARQQHQQGRRRQRATDRYSSEKWDDGGGGYGELDDSEEYVARKRRFRRDRHGREEEEEKEKERRNGNGNGRSPPPPPPAPASHGGDIGAFI
ncbi:hypothetical protein VTK26DRAFT_2015 [Humicola hyalothermophila]